MGRTFLSTLSPTILNPFHTGFGEDAGMDSGCFSSLGTGVVSSTGEMVAKSSCCRSPLLSDDEMVDSISETELYSGAVGEEAISSDELSRDTTESWLKGGYSFRRK